MSNKKRISNLNNITTCIFQEIDKLRQELYGEFKTSRLDKNERRVAMLQFAVYRLQEAQEKFLLGLPDDAVRAHRLEGVAQELSDWWELVLDTSDPDNLTRSDVIAVYSIVQKARCALGSLDKS